MRLEINAGGLDSFFNGIGSFLSAGVNAASSDMLINSFQTVANKTSGVCGGVGTLGTALGYIQTRKVAEENRKIAVGAVQSKANSFIQTALSVDKAVATAVSTSQEAFYRTNPWLRPPAPPSDWDKFWGGVADTASSCWDGLVDFYKEHKKVIDTVLIVVGAVLAIVAVVCTGGMALAPLLAAGLGALGVSAGTALTIATVTSLVVAGISVVSTLASSTLNIIDTWGEIDNPAFNTWQSVLNWTSGISNGLYSIGSMYNSFKGISNASLRQYSKEWISNPGFRSAIRGADNYQLLLNPNSSNFWSGLGKDGENIAKGYAANNGGVTLESTLDAQGIKMPKWDAPGGPEAWRNASASYAMRSSGGVRAILGNVRPNSVWNTAEKLLLNINPNITGITQVVNFGTSLEAIVNIPRVFEIGSLFSWVISAGSGVVDVFEALNKK